MINEPKYLIKSDVENVLKEWASKAWQDEWKPTHDSVRGDTFMEAMLIVNDMPPIDIQPVNDKICDILKDIVDCKYLNKGFHRYTKSEHLEALQFLINGG